MNAVLALTKRNVLCFFRDRAAVLFSFLTALIVVLLYLLFLRNVLISSMSSEGWTILSGEQLPSLVDSWVMAGIIGIVSVTSCAGSLQCMVDDKVSGKDMCFRIAPIKPSELAAGYVLSAFLAGFIVSAATLAFALAYLCATGCELGIPDIFASILLLVPSALSSSIILFALASLLKSQSAYTGFSIIMSTLIGLLYGLYLPMVAFPKVVYAMANLIPATHMAALFRQHLCSGPMDDVFGPGGASEFREEMGVDLSVAGYEFTETTSILYVLAVTALFFAISVLIMRKRRNRCPHEEPCVRLCPQEMALMSTAGSFDMNPSTPISRNLSAYLGLSTVHANAFMPLSCIDDIVSGSVKQDR